MGQRVGCCVLFRRSGASIHLTYIDPGQLELFSYSNPGDDSGTVEFHLKEPSRIRVDAQDPKTGEIQSLMAECWSVPKCVVKF